MRKLLLIGFLSFFCLSLLADGRLDIPLTMYVVKLMPLDGPTGSTPDPTDPNQFRASLSGNTLLIETQKGTVSYGFDIQYAYKIGVPVSDSNNIFPGAVDGT